MTVKALINYTHYFGACPECAETDGYVNIESSHWFICDTHRVKWCVGGNLFSSWQMESEVIWKANAEKLHTDHTNQEMPPKFAMLYAVAVPDKGGATSVCNARAAYEALPDDVKQKIVDAKTENTLISSARMKTGNPDVVKAQL